MPPMIFSVSQFLDLFLDSLEKETPYRGSTPWDQSFPPLDVWVNSKTKDVRFTFALAGYSDSEIDIKFEDDALVLNLKQEIIDESKRTKEEYDYTSSWEPIRHGIKKPKTFMAKYDVPFSKYDVSRAEAKRDNGLLVVTIPLAESAKPISLKIN